MAINGVNTSASTLQQQVASERQAQFQPVERPQRQQVNDSGQTDEARQAQAQRRAAEVQAQDRSQRVEQPKPVVNAQGQKTGTIINTTA